MAEAEQLPPPATADRRRSLRRRVVLLATSGLLLCLLAMLVVALLGFLHLDLRTWLSLLAVTLFVQGCFYLAIERRWDEGSAWDAHFVYAPTIGFVTLFGLYIHAVPEVGVYALMAWPVALLFLVGYVGFRDVTLLSALMAITYSVALVGAGGAEWPRALTGAAIFLVINLFSAVVHQRLRAQRLMMKEMRAALADQAFTDALTRLPNRRYLEEFLRTELERVRRYGHPCSVAMLDIDHFKNYNDTLGHLAGDAVLEEVARQMTRHLRTSDVLTRYGGEEFALVMPNTAKGEAMQAVERMRALLEDHRFPREEIQPGGQLTVSGGVATAPADGVNFVEILEAADQAMYLAKRGGRNRVEQTQARADRTSAA
jgi:diguanylate cyclase (GGDEF)-like protein